MKKLQHRFIQNILLISTLPLVILAIITIAFLNRMAVQDADERIKNNLNIVLSIYQDTCNELKYLVRDQNRKVNTLIWSNQLGALRKELKKFTDKNNLDFFIVTDEAGKVIVSVSNPFSAGVDLSSDYFIRKALNEKETIVSTEVLSEPELRRLEIVKKAKIAGYKDPVKGLVIKAVTPVINEYGGEAVEGTMTAGILLNNNPLIVDKIKESTKYTSSIFLGDVRIATNLPYPLGKFALGSKIDARAGEDTLKNGKRYIGRMWIVNEWYRVGYVPLYNYERNIVAILAIGIPENYIFVLRDTLMTFFAVAVFISIILAFMIGVLKGGKLVHNITALRNGIEVFVKGDYSHRIEIKSGDEIGELGEYFNQTMEQLKEAEERAINSVQRLGQAEKQLHTYEKMALIGKMATIINHELRNVFAGIQMSVSYLKNKGINDRPNIADYLKDIENGLNYANEILSNLLRLSYPKKIILSDVDLNFILEDLLSSLNIQGMVKNNRVEVIKKLDTAVPRIKADGLQIREVFLNLIINSLQAMPEGGKLEIISRKDKDFLKVEVLDTGGGIPQETLEHIFTPFFTTKSKGMGLGLCISKDIIEAHKGTIKIDTDSAVFTKFIIELPWII